MARRIGLGAGIAVFVAVCWLPAPDGLSPAAQRTAATTLLMAVWWLTEAVPVAVTAMVPLVVLPLVGVLPAAEIAPPYASKTNFLFLGGLIIATALERWNLHRRIALQVIVRFGSSPAGLLLGFMTATALISAWISNSATTMMMLPIAMAVLAHYESEDAELGAELGPILLVAIAYSATIGGIATIVGTPPNAVFVGAFAQLFPDGPEIGFVDWMLVGVPLVLVLVPLAWLYLVRGASRLGALSGGGNAHVVRDELDSLGAITVPERRVLAVFVATALLWMFRRDLVLGFVTLPGWAGWLPAPSMVGDSTVAIAMAVLLFVLPAGDDDDSRLLDWPTAVRLPWGVILLLGGGFALAEAIRASGLADWIGGQLSWVGTAPVFVSIALLCLVISFVTEITTNTAITTIMMPILAASAVAGNTDPLLLMVPCTMSASLCFMMPSGTAPNAIVFSGGRLTVAQMARIGLPLNLLAVVLVTLVVYFVAIPVLGVSLAGAPAWATGG